MVNCPGVKPNHDAAANRLTIRRTYCNRQILVMSNGQGYCKHRVRASETPLRYDRAYYGGGARRRRFSVRLEADRISGDRVSPGDS